jgi:hypothetical protein
MYTSSKTYEEENAHLLRVVSFRGAVARSFAVSCPCVGEVQRSFAVSRPYVDVVQRPFVLTHSYVGELPR